MAMLGGRTLGGINPQDAWQQMQATSNEPTLLARLSATSPPGGGGSWQLSPDQFDRNREHSEDEMRGWQSGAEEQRGQRRARARRGPYRGRTPRQIPRRA
jgi:hypothetical protein